ncbi:MAG: TRAP transporter large permease subunit [Deltaproteobacteria bacterium]|nr:TRAP transporter large permease subunit [Deltaproteobacteria bacterium]
MDPQALYALVLIIGGLLFLMSTGLPVAFCFTIVTLTGAIILWGYEAGLTMFIHNIYNSVSKFYLLPICMFMLMGQIMFLTGMGMRMLDVMNKWLGRLPGRLALLSVAFSTLFATMSGSMMASASLMGTLLLPEMEKRGYSKAMTIGPILGAGGLAMIIPPSGLAILLAAISGISVGRLLIAGLIPGLIMASLYAGYIIIRCWLQPSVAPAYDVERIPIIEKLVATVQYVLPLTSIIFLVLGLIFLGWTTPTEAAVLGASGSLVLAACYNKLNWDILQKSIMSTVRIAGNILLIFTGAITFSQILAFSGATRELANFVSTLPLSPIMIMICMQLLLLVMGTFMDTGSMAMVTMPVFMPIILALKINPIWFGVVILINMEMSAVTPPVGMMLFVMKGVSPPGTTMADVYKAGLPFLSCDLVAMALVMVFPVLALWLPGMMG